MPGLGSWHLSPGMEAVARAESAVVHGRVLAGAGAVLAQGAIVRAQDGTVRIGSGSAVLENCALVGTAELPVSIGRKVVFGHRCLVIGASVGDLSEIGNGTIILPGARLGRRVF